MNALLSMMENAPSAQPPDYAEHLNLHTASKQALRDPPRHNPRLGIVAFMPTSA